MPVGREMGRASLGSSSLWSPTPAHAGLSHPPLWCVEGARVQLQHLHLGSAAQMELGARHGQFLG